MQSVENIQFALAYLKNIISGRFRIVLHHSDEESIIAPVFQQDESAFTRFLNQHNPSFEEYVILLLALTPHLQPDFFTDLIKEYFPEGGDFPAFGGVKGQNHRGLLPTGETVQFVLAGHDLTKRLEIQQLFNAEHWFAKKGILWLETLREGEPAMSGRLLLDAEWVERMTTGQVRPPRFSSQFPAERLSTQMDWDDLVLPPATLRQIREIETWVRHHRTLLDDWGMARSLKPGYRALFHGPPGTGKTFTATLLGKRTGREVFRIDLSLVVSKFIGETEKNLSALFEKAQNKDWILFFDEADALFGKRTDVRDAHDKYANQEVSYLLQRIESFPGLVILASNFKSNIDEAFMRRFQSVVYFPLPKAAERRQLWGKAFPPRLDLGEIDLDGLAQKYEISGAAILNVVQYACLQALERGDNHLQDNELREGIAREFNKEGKVAH